MCVASGEQLMKYGQVKRIDDGTVVGCCIATRIYVRGMLCV